MVTIPKLSDITVWHRLGFWGLLHAGMIPVVPEEQSDPCGPSGAVPVCRAVLSPAVSPGLVPTTRSR